MLATNRSSPGQSRARATVDAIVEAAAQLLEERGSAEYNTNAIAARAGVSVGSLYRYFASKEAVAAALVQREGDALIARAGASRTAPGAREALIHLIDAAVEHRLRRPELARALDQVETWAASGTGAGAQADTLERIVGYALTRPGLARVLTPRIAASDLVAILKAMVDAAAARGEQDGVAIARRVRAAVFGYLDRAHTA